jgi:acyl-coenzyme A thioesterase PaaI-like protein
MADDERHAAAAALTAELRAIGEALVNNEPDPTALASATRNAREIREQLDGTRRLRWYDDADAAENGESRRAYGDLSPVRGELNPVAPPLRLEFGERADGTPIVVGRATLGRAYEGPPHGVHGGWVAALFDDLLGMTQGLADQHGVTGTLEIKYRAITPLEQELCFEGWIAEQRGRRLIARGKCTAGGRVTAEAKGLFVAVDFDELEKARR